MKAAGFARSLIGSLSGGASDPGAILAAADAARDRGDWADAAGLYDQFLALVSDNPAIWIQLGNVAKEAGEFARSLAAYQQAQVLDDDLADLHLQLGHLHKLRRNLTAALQHYERAGALDPGNAEIAEEIRRIRDRHAELPFLLGPTSLDDRTFDNLPSLISYAEQPGFNRDPFDLFSTLVSNERPQP